ncbi:MAG TPA: SAM-dependent methyltransferase [Opitutaceae bacterium]
MTVSEPRAVFLALVRASLSQGTFRRLVLGKPRGGSSLRKLAVEPGTGRFQLLYTHATRDITKHGDLAHVLAEVEAALGTSLFSAHLFTPTGTPQFEINKKGEGRLTRGPAAVPAEIKVKPHDRQKLRRITPANAPWMHPLGLATADGAILESMQGKYRQLEKFVEIVDRLLADAALREAGPLHVVDMGSGKGYLTFGVWHHLRLNLGIEASVTGIEARPELVELCNNAATAHGCAGLRFIAGEIGAVEVPPAEMVIALHACDTATDDALFHAVSTGARVIVSAPCCHKEVRLQLKPPADLEPLLRDGIQRERMAELLTDAVRARLLEASGYKTQVFEFISTEHTAKNTMITGVRVQSPRQERIDAARAEAAALLARFGIAHQRLAERIGVLAATA